MREVARRLDRSPSTISRELRRNSAPHDGGIYDSDLAHARARERASRRRAGRLAADDELRAVVQDKLDVEWSPEQISAWLRLEHPDKPRWHLCHETIYQAVYNPARGGLSRQFTPGNSEPVDPSGSAAAGPVSEPFASLPRPG